MSRIKDSSQTFKANRHLSQTRRKIESSTHKLASGKRINSASDDAAGLSISNKMEAGIRSEAQAWRNANDSISVMQVMEGGIMHINDLLIRTRELAIQSASDTISNKERSYLHQEAGSIVNEISRLAKINQFNGNKLMNGKDQKLEIQVGKGNESSSKLSFDLKDMAQDSFSLGVYDISLDTQHHAGLSLHKIDSALRQTSKSLAKIGGFQSRIQNSLNALSESQTNHKDANSRIMDTDYAQASADNIKNKIILENQLAVQSTSRERIAAYLKLLE